MSARGRTRLFLDIETLPGDESLREEIARNTHPPSGHSTPEALERWEEEQKPEQVEHAYRRTALRGHAGRILCIGYVKESPDRCDEGVLTGDEPSILRAFWDLVRDVDLFVGFNVLDFDLKFILQRSIVNRVPPSRPISFRRFQQEPVYDVMREWEAWSTRDTISLDTLSRALGMESPKSGGVDGSQVYDFYLAGRVQEIYDYCLRDVRVTREIYRRMTFEE